jgi:hypothetical protein
MLPEPNITFTSPPVSAVVDSDITFTEFPLVPAPSLTDSTVASRAQVGFSALYFVLHVDDAHVFSVDCTPDSISSIGQLNRVAS